MRLPLENTADVSSGTARAWRAITLVAALWLLNAMLTFFNVWPTVLIHASWDLSVELAATLLLLAAWLRLRGALPRRLPVVLAVLFVLGAIGRYAEVTAPALYGRDVNLYWDLPHVTSLVGMLTRVASPWLIAGGIVGLLAGLALLYFAALWSLRRIASALQSPPMRAGLSIVAIVMIGLFTLQSLNMRLPGIPHFAMPITETYGDQFAKVGKALTEHRTAHELPPSPAFSSTLSLSGNSDVVVVFLESYGRVAYDNRDFFQSLAPARAELAAAVRETGRVIGSGYVESPTFGGGSWLAHLNFLSGVEARDVGRAQLLMTQTRRTFGDALAEHGYRRVALMPGLKWNWPEGIFYGFDKIYDEASLDYRGPAFGWWRLPDQFSLAKLEALEFAPRATEMGARKPLFVMFPTISTHTPFRPTPPYQSDWSRMLSAQPYDAADVQQSLAQLPEWTNMGDSYKAAVAYELRTLAGFLRTQQRDDLIVIILGDHQPPAMVSGEHASWDVPVHVIASKPELLAALQGCGFVSGLIPAPVAMGRMHQLGPSLLYAFEHDATRRAIRCPMGRSNGASDGAPRGKS